MVKLSVLAERPDFRIGPIRVSPARRRIEGPVGELQAQPLVFQAFLLLLDSRGRVVTRAELFDSCWGSAIVGDDSLNRLIYGVRDIAAKTSPGLFEVERIPRTGYRMVGDILSYDEGKLDERAGKRLSRRTFALGSLAAVGVGGLGLWSVRRNAADEQFKDLMDSAQEALLYGAPFKKAVELLQLAVAMRPSDAKVHGLLAYAQSMSAEQGDKRHAALALQDAEVAASAALELDPMEPNARVAKVVLQRSTLDLEATEDRLRQVLVTDPKNTLAMKHLWDLMQSTGQSLAAFTLNARAIGLHPLAAAYTFPRAQLLWIIGRNAEADRVIDRATGFWPTHPGVRFARLTIFGFTGRPRAALAMLNDERTRPQNFTPAMTSVWRVSLEALEQRSQASISSARRVILDAVRETPPLALPSAFMLSALGEVDAAFEVANDFLLFRQPIEFQPGVARSSGKSTGWRFTPWLFIPPTKAMRLDARFGSLCDGLGLTEYWTKRGIRPDDFLMRA